MQRIIVGPVWVIVAAMALVIILCPAGAHAGPPHSDVFITDPLDHTRKAHVDANGALKAQPALAQTSLVDGISLDTAHAGGSPASLVFGQLFTPDQKVALTSLTLTNLLDNTLVSTVVVQAFQPISGDCGGVGGSAVEVGPAIFLNVAPKATTHLDFPYPFVVPSAAPSADWCLRAFLFGADRQVALTAVGYLP
jgi:hypothetical protein